MNSGFLLFESACQDLGIASMMEEVEYIQNSNLVKIHLEEHGPSIDVYFVTRSDNVPSKVQKRFAELLSV